MVTTICSYLHPDVLNTEHNLNIEMSHRCYVSYFDTYTYLGRSLCHVYTYRVIIHFSTLH